MKKTLLSMIALCALAIPQVTMAQSTQEVIFCYDNVDKDLKLLPLKYTTMGGKGTQCGYLIYMSEGETNAYKGGKITEVRMVSSKTQSGASVNKFIDAELVFRYEKSGRSFYHQSIQFGSEPLVWNSFKLDEAVTIEDGVPFYVGYTGSVTADECGTAVYSGMREDEETEGAWALSTWGEWFNKSKTNGNLMIELVIQMGDGSRVVSTVGKKAQAVPGAGEITLSGDFKNARVFDINGMQVANVEEAATVKVAAGLYLVSFDNGQASKVFVK